MELTSQQIKHIAKLARLELDETELEKFGNQLSGILGYIEMLQEVDTDSIQPTAQVTGLENVFKEDTVLDWNDTERENALDNSPEREGRFVKVKKVFD
jgi:aspartyl-tRNA(Asn)/glutamyl-tRNA(Gln) amidotransferase subunit C